MTAQQQFNTRLQELNLFNEWHNRGEKGNIAIEQDDGIHIFTHIPELDDYSEVVVPSLKYFKENLRIFVSLIRYYGKDILTTNKLIDWYEGKTEFPLRLEELNYPGGPSPIEHKFYFDSNTLN